MEIPEAFGNLYCQPGSHGHQTWLRGKDPGRRSLWYSPKCQPGTFSEIWA